MVRPGKPAGDGSFYHSHLFLLCTGEQNPDQPQYLHPLFNATVRVARTRASSSSRLRRYHPAFYFRTLHSHARTQATPESLSRITRRKKEGGARRGSGGGAGESHEFSDLLYDGAAEDGGAEGAGAGGGAVGAASPQILARVEQLETSIGALQRRLQVRRQPGRPESLPSWPDSLPFIYHPDSLPFIYHPGDRRPARPPGRAGALDTRRSAGC